MKIKVIGIDSSPRKNGNTEQMIKLSLKVIGNSGISTEIIKLSNYNILPCTACYACKESSCPLDDKDDVHILKEKMKECDAIIIGSPVYFGGISPFLSGLFSRTLDMRILDRFQLKNKIGGSIVVGGARNGGQEFTSMIIHNWMLIHNMIVVSDAIPTSHFGGIGVASEPGSVINDEVGLKTAENFGKRIAEVMIWIHQSRGSI